MPNTSMTRMPEKAVTDLASLHDLLDEAYVAHVGLVRDGHPLVVPTGMARDGDRLLVHGSTGSGWLRELADGADACVTVTSLDGLVVARSAFESSFQYRSAVLFGRFTALTGPEKTAALDVLVEKLVPGRTAEVRATTGKELAATLVLALPIEQWSLRVSDKWPEDEPDDVAGDAWAGVVPLEVRFGHPRPAPGPARRDPGAAFGARADRRLSGHPDVHSRARRARIRRSAARPGRRVHVAVVPGRGGRPPRAAPPGRSRAGTSRAPRRSARPACPRGRTRCSARSRG